tara:strand:- start:602 stop:760 length:159 start_codon:yes stop_codon:yes gene_type:complete
MPFFHITYTTPRSEGHEELEWIAPTDWDEMQTRDCFQRRNPDAAIIQFRELP